MTKNEKDCKIRDFDTKKCLDEKFGIKEKYPLPKLKDLRELYDNLRSDLPKMQKTDMFVVTSSVSLIPRKDVLEIIDKIKKFDRFEDENEFDEHDLIFVKHKGEDFFLKFDWYGGREGWRIIATLGRSIER